MSTTDEKRLIGYVCEKGNHVSLDGNSDHGFCGMHYYAEVYITVERIYHEDGTPHYGRGQEPDLDEIAANIREAVVAQEAHGWCGYEQSDEG